MSNDAELRRKILDGLIKRLEARCNGHAVRTKNGLQSLTDLELETAVEHTVGVREEAGKLRREIFHERAARRLKGGGR